jgi:hypothetical protein
MNIPIDNEEVSKIHVVKKPNRKVPMTDVYNPHFPWCGGAKAPKTDIQSTLKRMRRDLHSNVSFDAEIKVCGENDVDTLLENVSTRPLATGALPQSILRTAAIEDFENSGPARSSISAGTKRKFEAMELKPEGTEPKRQKQFRRRHSAYSRGSWACSSDCEIIDTSGASGSFAEFERYNVNLDIDADHLDAVEE